MRRCPAPGQLIGKGGDSIDVVGELVSMRDEAMLEFRPTLDSVIGRVTMSRSR
jgi:hypothetical protein